MNKEQLTKFKAWFDTFVAGFYGNDDFINANIRSKEEHTRRVCEETLYLADELKLDENCRLPAETISLLHDVGRFPQFIKYKTYIDSRSIDHCELAIDIIRKEKLLADLSADEQKLIETAIKKHGDKKLNDDLTGEALLFSRLIRDADKLDIYHVVTEKYIRHRDDPENFQLIIDFPDVPQYTPDVLEAVLAGRLIDYDSLRTWNDMKLCVVGWVYDINFAASLKRIKQRRCLELIFDFLPDNPDTAKVRDKIFTYVNSRIGQ
ncbi:MAG: HD domain-containing protein [Sedimentisphaerales bacterium]|nr:HD domain-containing protein [Sedimentisphaerales bacterium]